MSFKLSKKSLKKLEGVDRQLVMVVESAIKLSTVDFSIICGLRTLEQQKALFKSGASQTMKSKHLTGRAVDVMAFIGNRASWELELYDNVANSFRIAATRLGVPIRWGGAWHCRDITKTNRRTMYQVHLSYIDFKRKKGQRPFIDAPHFELN